MTGEPIRRYGHPHPGSMIHVDVTKFGNIPDGGGHKFVGPQQGDKNVVATAIEVLRHAMTWFAARGVTVGRVLSDNGSCFRSYAWRDACAELNIKHKRTRPYRPQTNGKIERFHRTLADGWAYARFYDTDTARRDALPTWIHFYNHHRLHSVINGTPISRLNLPGHHI